MVKGKTADKWKAKMWYTVYAPEMFENKEIGCIPASDEKQLLNRVIKVNLADISGDLSKIYVVLKFRIIDVKGKSAYTKLIGHELSKTYLRTLVRRRKDIINEVDDVITKDGVPLRIKVRAFTVKKVSTSARTAIRNILKKELKERTKNADFSYLAQEIVFGKFSARLFNQIKKIAPIRRVEIRKTEVKEEFAK